MSASAMQGSHKKYITILCFIITEHLHGPWVTVRFQLQLPVPGTLPSFVRDQQSLAEKTR